MTFLTYKPVVETGVSGRVDGPGRAPQVERRLQIQPLEAAADRAAEGNVVVDLHGPVPPVPCQLDGVPLAEGDGPVPNDGGGAGTQVVLELGHALSEPKGHKVAAAHLRLAVVEDQACKFCRSPGINKKL